MELGKTNVMKVVRVAPQGLYLEGDATGDVLLPKCYVPRGVKVGDEIEVFLYLDQDERIVGTTLRPKAMVGDFACLQVSWVNNYGAFLDWGLMKDLFVPFREQKMKMKKGNSYIVHVHIDPETGRIMASAKVERWLRNGYGKCIGSGKVYKDVEEQHGSNCNNARFLVDEQVDLLVWQKSDLGFKVIINNEYAGLVYENELFTVLHTGDRVKGYIRQVRPDGKIDVALQPTAREAVADFADVLLRHLQINGGSTPVNDHSDPEEIHTLFGVSKKVFKQAVGRLYRERKIEIRENELVLVH